MRTKAAPVEVVCVQCSRPFTMSLRAYAQRTARYGAALRCPHCIGDHWLRTGDGYRVDALLRDETSEVAGATDNRATNSCHGRT